MEETLKVFFIKYEDSAEKQKFLNLSFGYNLVGVQIQDNEQVGRRIFKDNFQKWMPTNEVEDKFLADAWLAFICDRFVEGMVDAVIGGPDHYFQGGQ